MMKKLTTLILVLISLITLTGFSGDKNKDYLKKVDDQVRAGEISDMKFGMFICWSFSTFSGQEWTPTEDKDASYFKATGCDTDQWCKVAKKAGMHYILFLTKHHDGFCLWDTETTKKKVTNSPPGIDVLARLRKSCDRYGIKLALYFSEGDWTFPGASFSKSGGINPDIIMVLLPAAFVWVSLGVLQLLTIFPGQVSINMPLIIKAILLLNSLTQSSRPTREAQCGFIHFRYTIPCAFRQKRSMRIILARSNLATYSHLILVRTMQAGSEKLMSQH